MDLSNLSFDIVNLTNIPLTARLGSDKIDIAPSRGKKKKAEPGHGHTAEPIVIVGPTPLQPSIHAEVVLQIQAGAPLDLSLEHVGVLDLDLFSEASLLAQDAGHRLQVQVIRIEQ